MDPHPLANLFKRSNYDEPISSDLSALDYLYEVLLEIRESETCDEEIYEEIHDSSLNKKHDCNDFTINSLDVNCANNMQNYKIGDDNFVMSTTYCNDHDWGDNASYDLENLFKLLCFDVCEILSVMDHTMLHVMLNVYLYHYLV